MDTFVKILANIDKRGLNNIEKYEYNLIMIRHAITKKDTIDNITKELMQYISLPEDEIMYNVAINLQNDDAIKWHIAAADNGSRESQIILAQYYKTGTIVQKDIETSMHYEKMSNKIRFDIFCRPFIYDETQTERDKQMIRLAIRENMQKLVYNCISNMDHCNIHAKLQIYLELTAQNYIPALLKCAEIYESLKNYDDANKYYKYAAHNGDVLAQLYFAKKYEKNDSLVIHWLENISNNIGTVNTQDEVMEAKRYAYSELGKYYYSGIFVEQNYEKAFEYFKLANDHKNMAICYSSGKGVEKDNSKAEHLLLEVIKKHPKNFTNDLIKYYEYEDLIKGIECGDLIVS